MIMFEEKPPRCGYVAIVGRPNVGKSTLLNQILGQKLCITAHKPQTTRHRILGIKSEVGIQTLYVDTPGIHGGGKRALNRVLNRSASSAVHDVDAIIFVVQALVWTDNDELVLDKLKKSTAPVFVAVNKVDEVPDKELLFPFLQQLSEMHDFAEIVPISAKKGRNVEHLESAVNDVLPEQMPIYPEDQLTDRSSRFLAAELVREQLTRMLDQELPYGLSVEIERFKYENAVNHIHAIIWVERSGQKGIVIGKGGSQLKEVGTRARKAMEKLFDDKVNLKLWVKIKQGWADDERALHSLGYGVE